MIVRPIFEYTNKKCALNGLSVALSSGPSCFIKYYSSFKSPIVEVCTRRFQRPILALWTNPAVCYNAKTFGADTKRHGRLGAARSSLHRRSTNILQDLTQTKQRIKQKVGSLVERENIWTIPNFLCVSRIIVTPYMGYLIINNDCKFALYILAFAGFTDWLDGFIARNFKSQSSKFGSFLDPMADKILMATLFLSLTYAELMPLVLTSVIVARDVILFGSGFYIRYLSLPKPITFSLYFDASHASAQLKPTFISKINTLIQLCTAAVTLSSPVFGFTDHPYLLYLWWSTGISTVISGLSYVFSKDTYKIIKDAKSKRKNV